MKTSFGDHVRVAADGHVAVVTVDRPPYNHVTVGFMRDLADAFDAIDGEIELRCSVLQAEGKNFCAGADLVSREDAGGLGSVNPLYDEAVRLFSARKPIVAAVQGAAVGAGLGLAVMADFRVASPDARFAANFVKLGFHPGFGLTHTLPRLIGHTKAAAGSAGLIKAALSLYHKVIPPTLKAGEPDPNLNIEDSPFYLNSIAKPWFSGKMHPRRAGVS